MPARADDNPRTPIGREWILGALDSSGIKITPDQMEQLSSCDSDGSEASIESGECRSSGWGIRQSSIAMPTSQHLPSLLCAAALGTA